jgi:hypothetical protein
MCTRVYSQKFNILTLLLFYIVHRIKPDGTAVKYESEVRTVDAFEAFVKETLA